jgi:signal peptidase
MKKALKIIAIGFYALIALAAVFFAVPQSGWKALSVQTGSMTPAIPKGSLVIIHNVPLGSIKVGQVVTYREPSKPSVTITHRVIRKSEKGNIPMFTTKGDANKVADATIPGGSIVGVVQLHAAGLGKVIDWLHKPLGIIVLVGLPGLLIIISEFQLMIRRLQDYTREEAEEKARKLARRIKQPIAAPFSPAGGGQHRSVRGPIIRAMTALILVPTLALAAVHGTLSQITSSVSLTNNQLGVAASSTNPGGGTTTPSCSNSTNISITNTGPGSTNTANSNTNCSITNTNNTSVSVTNNSSQTATSGSVSSSDNGSSGSTSSGGASNNSNSDTTVTTNSSD